MRAPRIPSAVALLFVFATWMPSGHAVETCGDGVDQATANGFLDEGCDPYGALQMCESPLDCATAGRVAPLLGQLVYPLKPDISVATPLGPSLVFQRTFQSLYNPGYFPGGVSDHQDSLGYRMHHNYMSWVTYLSGSSPNRKFALHMPSGQDVLLTETAADATYYNFTAQASWHFKAVRMRISTSDMEVILLTGESYLYTSANGGKLTQIRDSLAAPQELLITYVNGKVDKVEDEARYRYLKFEYFSTGTKLLQYVKLYEATTPSATLHLTVEFTYSTDKLSTVKLASTTHETWSYDASGYPTTIVDGGSKTIAEFLFSSAGKLQREHTQGGDVGYTYNDTGNCAANETGIYFNRYETGTTCTQDTVDYLCGGWNGTNGWKFRALRCVAVTTSTEDLVNTIAAHDPAATCASCRDVQDYDWDTTVYRVKGTKSADGIWTSNTRDGNGMITLQLENDTDGDATTDPGNTRVTYFTYGNSTFPGLLTERRIKSELEAGTCNAGTPDACKRTLYTWSSDGKLASRQEIGSTYNNAGTRIDYDYTTSYSYDSKGRLTELTGPRTGIQDDVVYTYQTGAGLSLDYLNETKQKNSDTPTYLITTTNDYTIWGRPKRATDPNSKSICKTYHAEYGLPLTSRIVVNGSHTDCATSGGNDETTSWTYDTARRVTKTTKPRSNCAAKAYDSNGRLSEVQEQDYVSPACQTTGDKTVYTYDAEGLVTKVEWKDDAGTVKRSQEYTYLSDRRVDRVKNPADTSKYQDWAYDDDGVPSQVLWEDYATSSAQLQWDIDELNRTEAIRRYTTANDNEAFAITAGVQLDLPTRIADPAGQNLDLVWDDLNRKVKQVTPEGGTNFYVYDAAGNVTEMVLASGTADSKTTTYTYDNANRRTAENTGDATCFTLGGAELQYTFDALPAGVSCPSGSNCSLLSGRLAHVKVKIYCDDAQGDDRFDQSTFYSYTEAGRIAEHTVQDDAATPRVGRVIYTYDKNGNATRIDYPAGATTGAVYTFGGVSYSDDDRVGSIKRDTTSTLTSIKWFPFGPVDTMAHQNVFVHAGKSYPVWVTYGRNNAYRATSITAATTFSTPDKVFKIDFAEDSRQRYTKREFPVNYGSGAEKDMFFLYDDLSRVTCRTTATAGSCPASGGQDQYESITYNNSSDRTQLILNNSVIASTTYNYKYVSGSDKIDCIRVGDNNSCSANPTTSEIDLTWDTRGNRLTDDDKNYSGTTDDLRTYTYDARDNLLTVTGKFYFAASTLHAYTLTYAYDERNRIIFKSFLDTTDSKEAQWFFYYDQLDRVIQAKYTPNISTSGTYSVFQWYWLEQMPFLYYQLDYVSDALSTTTRRYLYSDEQGRPHAAWSWPTTGDTARVWEAEAGTFGWDVPTVGATIYQPLRFPGQKYDADTEAVTLNGSARKLLRAGMTDNRYRVYDSFTGAYLQLDPLVASTGDAVAYSGQNPVMMTDRMGLSLSICIDLGEGLISTDVSPGHAAGMVDINGSGDDWSVESFGQIQTCFSGGNPSPCNTCMMHVINAWNTQCSGQTPNAEVCHECWRWGNPKDRPDYPQGECIDCYRLGHCKLEERPGEEEEDPDSIIWQRCYDIGAEICGYAAPIVIGGDVAGGETQRYMPSATTHVDQ